MSTSKLRFLPPLALTTLRLALAPTLLLLAGAGGHRAGMVACLMAVFLSDIYDGVLARRLGVARPWLRRFDSATDVIFYAAALGAAWIAQPESLRDHWIGIALLMTLELCCNGVSFIRFGRPPATHTYLAKLWGILLFATFVGLLGFGHAGALFSATIALGCAADIEVLAIMLISSSPPVDVPTFAAAMKRR